MPDTLDREYVYRCKLCNEIKIGATGNFTICEAEIHMCKNGDVGLAELIGVRKVLK